MLVKLKNIADVIISNVDKKVKENEKKVYLCNFTDVYNNYAITKKMYNNFMIASASKSQIDKFSIKKGYLAITKDSETRDDIGVGTFFADNFENLLLGYHCALIKPNESLVNSKFLNAYIQSPFARKYYELNASGSGQRYTLTIDAIADTPIYLPPYDVQLKIGHLLSEIDKQIERNNAIVKRLQVLGHSIFNHFFSSENNLIYFIDFPYIQIIKPGIIKFENKKHYIATAEIEGEQFNYNAPLIEYETRENRANMQPISNSVWFAKMKNSIKHIYVAQNDKIINQNYIFSTGFCGIKCEEFVFEYMINYLNLSYFEKKKDITSHGATMEGINNEDLKSFKIHLPTKDKLILFHNKAKEIYYEISRIRQATFQLTCLKNKLLPLLINGQLK